MVHGKNLKSNSLAPISRLPVEILTKAFLLVVEEDRETEETRPVPPSACLTHVCRDWRIVAINTPQLWCRISDFSSVWADIQLERSKNTNLCLRIFDLDADTQAEQRALHALSRTDQLRSIDCRVQRSSAGVPILRALDEKSALCLESFAIKVKHISDSNDPLLYLPQHFLNGSGGCPRLRRVDLKGWILRWTSSLLSGLTTLKLDTMAVKRSFGKLSELLDAFERMPYLAHFDLGWPISCIEAPFERDLQDSRVVPMRHLKHIEIHTSLRECLLIFEHITLPPDAWIDVEAMATRDAIEWDDCDEICTSFLPALATAFRLSWLSNPPSPAVGATEADESESMRHALTPIHTLLGIGNPGLNHPNCRLHFILRRGVEYPDILSNSQLSLTIVTPRSQGIERVGKTFLSLLPLTFLAKVAIHGDLYVNTFEFLGGLPSITDLSLKYVKPLIDFLEYVLGEINRAGSSTNPTHDSTGIRHDRVLPQRFPKLSYISITHVDFSKSLPFVDLTIAEGLLKYMCWRRDVAGYPLERIKISECSGMTYQQFSIIEGMTGTISAAGTIIGMDMAVEAN